MAFVATDLVTQTPNGVESLASRAGRDAFATIISIGNKVVSTSGFKKSVSLDRIGYSLLLR